MSFLWKQIAGKNRKLSCMRKRTVKETLVFRGEKILEKQKKIFEKSCSFLRDALVYRGRFVYNRIDMYVHFCGMDCYIKSNVKR